MAIRILIADDAPFIRELMVQIANQEGWDVVGEAENGQQAVELSQLASPDIIIMDLVMPVMSGLDATKEILSTKSNIKIVACSTVDDQGLVMRALDAGCVNYITKPFDKNSVVKIINSTYSLLQGGL